MPYFSAHPPSGIWMFSGALHSWTPSNPRALSQSGRFTVLHLKLHLDRLHWAGWHHLNQGSRRLPIFPLLKICHSNELPLYRLKIRIGGAAAAHCFRQEFEKWSRRGGKRLKCAFRSARGDIIGGGICELDVKDQRRLLPSRDAPRPPPGLQIEVNLQKLSPSSLLFLWNPPPLPLLQLLLKLRSATQVGQSAPAVGSKSFILWLGGVWKVITLVGRRLEPGRPFLQTVIKKE